MGRPDVRDVLSAGAFPGGLWEPDADADYADRAAAVADGEPSRRGASHQKRVRGPSGPRSALPRALASGPVFRKVIHSRGRTATRRKVHDLYRSEERRVGKE